MTKEQFIYWLKGFIDYQQLQEQKNPAFTRIKDELAKVGDTSKTDTTVSNQSVTYKTDVPVTYTSTEIKSKGKELNSYI